MKDLHQERRLNRVARATIISMVLGTLSAVAFLAAIILVVLRTPSGFALAGVMFGIALSVAFVSILLFVVFRRVRSARDARLAELGLREPGAVVVHAEWNAALQDPFVKEGALPAKGDSRGYDVEITADETGMRLWLGTSDLPLLGALTWPQITMVEPAEVHAAIGSHTVPAFAIHTTDTDTFLPVVELIYRGENIRELCTQLNMMRIAQPN